MPLYSSGTIAAPVVLGSGTLTASAPILDLTQTWNNAAVTFTGFKLNVTDTASAAASLLMDIQLAGTSAFAVNKAGGITLPMDTGYARWGSGTASILGYNGGSNLRVTVSSAIAAEWQGNSFNLDGTTGVLGFKYGSGPTNAPDTGISANAAGVIEINNGTPGTLRDLKLRHETVTGLRATSAAAPTIASTGTIAPTTSIVFISGTSAIATITAPAPIASGGGQITLIPTGIFTTTTAGNIALATTAVVNKALTMTYDTTTTKWYPSY
jgi:hypothetical protein